MKSLVSEQHFSRSWTVWSPGLALLVFMISANIITNGSVNLTSQQANETLHSVQDHVNETPQLKLPAKGRT